MSITILYFRNFNRHQGETMSKMFDKEFSIKQDMVFLTDGSIFQPDINSPQRNVMLNSITSQPHYCQLIHSAPEKPHSVESEYVDENRICDSRCDCSDCSDENELFCKSKNSDYKRLLDTKILGISSSPTLEALTGSGFWKIVKIPSNGSVSFRIPFMGGPHKQIELNSIAVRSRGKKINRQY